MQTERPSHNRKRIIAVVVILAVIAGGAGTYFFLLTPSRASVTPDFELAVKIGDANGPQSYWTPVTATTNMLNGTSLSLVVSATGKNNFNDFVHLVFTSPVPGVTGTMARSTLHPLAGGTSSTGLNVTAASDVATRKLYYNFSVTGTSGSLTHTFTFPLRLRATTVHMISPSAPVPKNSAFKVGIGVSDIYSFSGFQFTLNFNHTLLHANKTSIAPIFYPSGTIVNGVNCDTLPTPCDGYVAQNIVDNSTGTVSIAATLIGLCGTVAPCVDSTSGQSFTIANVTFFANSLYAGQSALKLTNIVLTLLEGQATVVLAPPTGFHLIDSTTTVMIVASPHSDTPAGLQPGLLLLSISPLILLGSIVRRRVSTRRLLR